MNCFGMTFPSLYLFKTSPHGERSISNSNDYSYYENPAKGLDQSHLTLDSVIFFIETKVWILSHELLVPPPIGAQEIVVDENVENEQMKK